MAAPAIVGTLGTGFHGVRPMDSLGGGAIASLPVAGSADVPTSSFGLAQVSAAAYNSMSAMNHMRFECGVDLKGLLKTSRKQLSAACGPLPIHRKPCPRLHDLHRQPLNVPHLRNLPGGRLNGVRPFVFRVTLVLAVPS